MTNPDLVRMVEGWGSKIVRVVDDWIEIVEIDGTKMLLHVEDESCFMVVTHIVRNQVTLEKIIEKIKGSGFESLPYTSGASLKCSTWAFFKKQTDGGSLQAKTDKFFGDWSNKIKELTQAWDEEKR